MTISSNRSLPIGNSRTPTKRSTVTFQRTTKPHLTRPKDTSYHPYTLFGNPCHPSPPLIFCIQRPYNRFWLRNDVAVMLCSNKCWGYFNTPLERRIQFVRSPARLFLNTGPTRTTTQEKIGRADLFGSLTKENPKHRFLKGPSTTANIPHRPFVCRGLIALVS